MLLLEMLEKPPKSITNVASRNAFKSQYVNYDNLC